MPEREDQFLKELESADASVRFAAWRRAGDMEPSVVPRLGQLMSSPQPGVRKAGREALTTLVHSVGKDTGSAKRAQIVTQLLALAGGDGPLPVRVEACRLLSLIAGEDSVAAIAKWIHSPELREEVVFCLERIPGQAPLKALIASYKEARDDFKPRILAALGHRRADDGVPLCLEAMRSANKEIAIAGVKAFGRIGRRPSSAPRFPETEGLSEWQKIDRMDSLLRYADAQVAQGNHAEAMRLYKTALDHEEEHWQCAAILGISKIGTAEAASTIFPKLKSANPTVRITARNAWKALAG